MMPLPYSKRTGRRRISSNDPFEILRLFHFENTGCEQYENQDAVIRRVLTDDWRLVDKQTGDFRDYPTLALVARDLLEYNGKFPEESHEA